MQVRIFTTGGTIDKTYFDANSEYRVGAPVVADIFAEVGVGLAFAVTELMRKDSLELTDEDRVLIRRAVEAEPARQVLITHGTDTMPETATALLGIANKTIVLTGAMRPAPFRNSDAAFNVGCALGAVQSLPSGVYVVMNGRVFAANEVRKNVKKGQFEQVVN